MILVPFHVSIPRRAASYKRPGRTSADDLGVTSGTSLLFGMARHFKLGRFFEGTAISIRLRHIVQHLFAPPLLLPRFLAIFRPPRRRHTLSHFAAIMTI